MEAREGTYRSLKTWLNRGPSLAPACCTDSGHGSRWDHFVFDSLEISRFQEMTQDDDDESNYNTTLSSIWFSLLLLPHVQRPIAQSCNGASFLFPAPSTPFATEVPREEASDRSSRVQLLLLRDSRRTIRCYLHLYHNSGTTSPCSRPERLDIQHRTLNTEHIT